jgi:PhnB protein
MAEFYKPEGYSTVSVYIVSEGAQRVIDFLKKTFGATQLRRFENPDGKIMRGRRWQLFRVSGVAARLR